MIKLSSSEMRVSLFAGVALVMAGAVNVYSESSPAPTADKPEAKSEAAEVAKPVAEVKAQETCPVMGGKINKADYVDHDGKRIYVCCKGCIAPIKKDPAKYIKALEADGVTLERVKSE